MRSVSLILFLLFVAARGLFETLSLDSAGFAPTQRGVDGEVNVFLALHSHDVTGHVHDLLLYSNVSLTDQHSGVVDGPSKTQFHHLRLQSSFQKVINLNLQQKFIRQ